MQNTKFSLKLKICVNVRSSVYCRHHGCCLVLTFSSISIQTKESAVIGSSLSFRPPDEPNKQYNIIDVLLIELNNF